MAYSNGFELMALLTMAHFLGDFGLQSDRMAIEKCPGCRSSTLPWQWWLTSHAAIHGFLVAWITGIPALGLAEWGAHTVIDLGKCQNRYRLGVDQALHLLCKVAWIALMPQAWTP